MPDLSPGDKALAAVHRRIVELEEAIVVDSIWQEKAAGLSYQLAMDSFAYWTNLRREHEELLREFRAIVEAAGPDPERTAWESRPTSVTTQWHHEAQADLEVAAETELERAGAWGK